MIKSPNKHFKRRSRSTISICDALNVPNIPSGLHHDVYNNFMANSIAKNSEKLIWFDASIPMTSAWSSTKLFSTNECNQNMLYENFERYLAPAPSKLPTNRGGQLRKKLQQIQIIFKKFQRGNFEFYCSGGGNQNLQSSDENLCLVVNYKLFYSRK